MCVCVCVGRGDANIWQMKIYVTPRGRSINFVTDSVLGAVRSEKISLTRLMTVIAKRSRINRKTIN